MRDVLTSAAHKSFGKMVSAVLLILLCCAAYAEARPYRLLWDANNDGVTSGYFVYYGTSRGVYQPAGGVDVGNATEFQIDLTPGVTYYFLVKAYNSTAVFGPPSEELEFLVPPDASLSVSTASPEPGAQISATAANGPGNSNDFVGIYALGAANNAFLQRKYLNNSTTPGGAFTGGSVTFTAPTQGGQYEARFVSSTLTTLATSVIITVPASTVTALSNSVTAGNSISASVAHSPGDPLDWVGFFPTSAGVSGFLYKKYLNNSTNPPSSGSNSGTVNFVTSPTLAAGSYNIRLISAAGATLATSSTVTVVGQGAQININGVAPPTTVNVSTLATVSAAVTVTGPNFAGDWVALFQVGAGASNSIDWKYLNGTQTRPAAGTASATVSFTIPSTPGNYQVRLYSNDTAQLVATSSTIVASASQSASVAANGVAAPTVLTKVANSTITAAISITGPAYVGDWIGLFRVGDTPFNSLDWKYMSGTQVRPATASPSASLSFVLPSMPGSYEIRVYSNDSITLVGQSGAINVFAPGQIAVDGVLPPAVDNTVVGATVSADVSISGPASRGDWVGLYRLGDSVTNYLDWKYLSNTQVRPGTALNSATVTFALPSVAGNYEVRLYADDSIELVGRSTTISASASQTGQLAVNTVVPPAGLSVAAGSAVSVGVSVSGPTYAGDWVGLYAVGASAFQAVDWFYLNGTKARPATALSSATLPFTLPSAPGNYELRLFSNDSVSVIAVSSTITATPSQSALIEVNGVSPPTVVNTAAGNSVSVQVTITGARYAGDWVGLFAAGGTAFQAIEWKYLNDTQTRPGAGTGSATVTLTLPASASGNYEVRLYSNDSTSLVATSTTISVP